MGVIQAYAYGPNAEGIMERVGEIVGHDKLYALDTRGPSIHVDLIKGSVERWDIVDLRTGDKIPGRVVYNLGPDEGPDRTYVFITGVEAL